MQAQAKIINILKKLNNILMKQYAYSFSLLKQLMKFTPTLFQNKIQLMVIILNNFVNQRKAKSLTYIKLFVQDKCDKILKAIFIVSSIVDRKEIMKKTQFIQRIKKINILLIEQEKNQNSHNHNENGNKNQQNFDRLSDVQLQKYEYQNQFQIQSHFKKKLSLKNVYIILNRLKKNSYKICFAKIKKKFNIQLKLQSRLQCIFRLQQCFHKSRMSLFKKFLSKLSFQLSENYDQKKSHIINDKTGVIFENSSCSLIEQESDSSYNPQLQTKIQNIKTISSCMNLNIKKSNEFIWNMSQRISIQKVVKTLQNLQAMNIRWVFYQFFDKVAQFKMKDCDNSKVQILQQEIKAIMQSAYDQ